MPTNDLTIILVNHNESRFLINWLDKMTAQFQGRIIMVDNDSTDNSVALVKHAFPKVDIIMMSKNTGPFGGFIEGCLATDSDYVACYSPDDEIKNGYIYKMIEAVNRFPMVDLYTCNCDVIREGIKYERILLPYTAYISPDYAVKMCREKYNSKINLCGLIVKRDLVLKMWEMGGKNMPVNFDCLFTFFTIFDKGFVNVGEKLFIYHSYPKSWGASRNKNKVWKAIKDQLRIYSNYPHVYNKARLSGVCDEHRHFMSNLALKTIMSFPKWFRKLLYNKIYSYQWEIEKL